LLNDYYKLHKEYPPRNFQRWWGFCMPTFMLHMIYNRMLCSTT
jgi:hypothetical protein